MSCILTTVRCGCIVRGIFHGSWRHMGRHQGLRLALLLAVLSSVPALSLGGAGRATAASAAIAHVRYIHRGLSVQAPHRHAGRGKVKQALYSRYALQTTRQQVASVNFRDGTLLHLNQLTNAVLRSPAVTRVTGGEVVEQVVPGTRHQVQTSAAVASAVGTEFDVQVKGKLT